MIENEDSAFISFDSILLQTTTLIEELERIDDQRYPPEACHIRDVFLAYADRLCEQLQMLNTSPHSHEASPADSSELGRGCAQAVHSLYSFLRYLRSSSTSVTPPGLQMALAHIAHLHFPAEQLGEPVCLVRPQWKYNLKCIHLNGDLKRSITDHDLDPDVVLGLGKEDVDTLSTLWKCWQRKLPPNDVRARPENLPGQIAILSFAGLDTTNVLLYPLLAHELGHFIDFAHSPQLSSRRSLVSSLQLTEDSLKVALTERFTEKFATINTKALWEDLTERVDRCIKELLADLLAVRMLGFPFFFAQAELLSNMSAWNEPDFLHTGYPGIQFRLRTVFNHLIGRLEHEQVRAFLASASNGPDANTARGLLTFVDEWNARLPVAATAASCKSYASTQLGMARTYVDKLGINLINQALPILQDIACEVVPDTSSARLTPGLFRRITRLEHDLPPSLPLDNSYAVSEILAAAWCFHLLAGKSATSKRNDRIVRSNSFQTTSALVLKAIELIPVTSTFVISEEVVNQMTSLASQEVLNRLREMKGRPIVGEDALSEHLQSDQAIRLHRSVVAKIQRLAIVTPNRSPAYEANLQVSSANASVPKCDSPIEAGVLSGSTIIRLIENQDVHSSNHIDVVPYCLNAVQGASMDVHLGNWFVVARRVKLRAIQMSKSGDDRQLLSAGREEYFVSNGDTFLIHPADFVLGCTLEFVALPGNLMAFVEGKSGLGRQGLIIATASQVAPGFHGVVVLELANSGTVPLEVKPGMPIGQLVFHRLTEAVPESSLYRGKYYCQIKP
jgi:dCTP deaminase